MTNIRPVPVCHQCPFKKLGTILKETLDVRILPAGEIRLGVDGGSGLRSGACRPIGAVRPERLLRRSRLAKFRAYDKVMIPD